VDLNRAGVPLAEIVSEPDMRSAAEARAYLTLLRQLLVYAGVSECSMEKGTLRVDANVSVRPAGDAKFGAKAEVKNLNSFANVERAIEVERARQISILEAGGRIAQETRLFNANAGTTKALRSKEESHDYRYFPDPDLPPLVLEQSWIDEQRATLPELPEAKRARFASEHGLPAYHAATLTLEQPVAEFFEKTVKAGAEPKAAADWILETVLTVYNEGGTFPVTPDRLAALVLLVKAGTVSKQAAKTVYGELLTSSETPGAIANRLGLVQVSDTGALGQWVDEVLAAHPGEVARFRGGEAKLIGFLVGQVMKKSGGKADPKAVQPVLQKKLSQ
jgi:aspartyl-tRNA(Asn)/glutamyl-tRNA(Gln) amidotransferase subunit B